LEKSNVYEKKNQGKYVKGSLLEDKQRSSVGEFDNAIIIHI
jgi:hypothetical protein